jgi:uncharacterized protein (TIGR02266 family)
MAQDTRKDPRAKVLTMTVRYKSATLDEFIEHHSHDVSRGGMFIKTPSPFPPGTLLKFEVKIAEDQKVMQGVGRVVWKREPSESADERPAGMGVKFIKIDDDSTRVIDQLVKTRGDGKAAFEAGEEPAPSRPPAVKPVVEPPKPLEPLKPAAAPAAAMPQRKATMIGLGSLPKSDAPSATEAKPEPMPAPRPEPEKKQESFFPKTESEKDMPPPEDRTVMKQAAELLQDALREAGGSMDEVGVAPVPAPIAESEKPEQKAEPSTPEQEPEKEPEKLAPAAAEAKPESERPTPAATSTPAPAPASGRIDKKVEKERAAPARAVKEEPSSRRPLAITPAAAAEPREGGGGGKAIALLLGVAAAAAAVFFLTRQEPSAPPAAPPEPTPTEQALEQPRPPEPAPVVTDQPAIADAAAVEPAATAETPTLEPPPEPKPEPEPKPRPAATAAPQPKPTAAPEPKPTAAPEPKPTAAPEPKPTATAAPQPKPQPKPKPTSDNPY